MIQTWNIFINFPKSFSGLPVEKVCRKITAQREKKKTEKSCKISGSNHQSFKIYSKKVTKKGQFG